MNIIKAKSVCNSFEVAIVSVASVCFVAGLIVFASWFYILQVDRPLSEKTKNSLLVVALLTLLVLFFALTIAHVLRDLHRAQDCRSENLASCIVEPRVFGDVSADSVLLVAFAKDLDRLLCLLHKAGFRQLINGGFFMDSGKAGVLSEADLIEAHSRIKQLTDVLLSGGPGVNDPQFKDTLLEFFASVVTATLKHDIVPGEKKPGLSENLTDVAADPVVVGENNQKL